MIGLTHALEDYLEIRRALGFDLRGAERRLRGFFAFMEDERASHITVELALRWARRPADGEPATWGQRLAVIRRFAAWYSTREPLTEVPPQGLIPYTIRRKPPYIYSDEEIVSLVQAARELPSSEGLRGHTFSTIIGLLAVTGMRVSRRTDCLRRLRPGAGARRHHLRELRLGPDHQCRAAATPRPCPGAGLGRVAGGAVRAPLRFAGGGLHAGAGDRPGTGSVDNAALDGARR